MEIRTLAIFGLVSIGLAYVSRRSLGRPSSHGFHRFFAWELMLVLLLLNLPSWFRDWGAWHQLVSWTLLAASLVPLWFGVRSLRTRGKPDARRRSDPALFGFERTTHLVTDGVYQYIRHPLYSSLFVLNWGIFFKRPSWLGMVMAVGASLLLIATARSDESECLETFGADYRQYMQHTRMFIPYAL